MNKVLCIFALLTLTEGVVRAEEMQVHLQACAGGLLTTGLSELSHSGAGGFSASLIWPVSDHLRLGLRQTLNLSVMPFGTEKDLALLPTTSFVFKIDPSPGLSLDVSLGAGLLASSEQGSRSLIPHPAAGAGVELILARHHAASLRLRVQCEVVYLAFQSPRPLLVIPQAGLLYVF